MAFSKKNKGKIGLGGNEQGPSEDATQAKLWDLFAFGTLNFNPAQWFGHVSDELERIFPGTREQVKVALPVKSMADILTPSERENLETTLPFSPNYERTHGIEPIDFSALSRVKFTDSSLGSQIEVTLNQMGMSHFFWGRALDDLENISSFEEIYGREPENWPHNSLSVSGMLDSGSALWTNIEIWRDSSGKEFAFWSSQILVTSSYSGLINLFDSDSYERDLKKALDFSYPSTLKYMIPVSMLKLAAVGENPGLIQLTRTYLKTKYDFSESFDEALLPTPGYVVERHAQVDVIGTISPGGQPSVNSFRAPDSIRFGWMFDEKSFANTQNREQMLKMIFNGLLTVAGCVAEGSEFGRGYTIDHDNEDLRHVGDFNFVFGSHWLPQTECFDRLNWTTEMYGRSLSKDLEREEKEELLKNCGVDGLGQFYPHAANDYVYFALIPKLIRNLPGRGYVISEAAEQLMDEIKFYLTLAIGTLNPEQQTIALANAGVAHYQVGDLGESESYLLAALQRPDGASEAKASYVLSLIYSERGNSDLASEYMARYEKSDGLNFAAQNTGMYAGHGISILVSLEPHSPPDWLRRGQLAD